MSHRKLALAVLGLAWLAGTALAQNEQGARGGRGRAERVRKQVGGEGARGFGGPGGPAMRGMPPMSVEQQVERLTKELQLTTEQQEKIRKLLADHRDAMQKERKARHEKMMANRDRFQDLSDQMRKARQSGDREKIRELQEQFKELIGGDGKMPELRDRLFADIEAVLTAEQKEKWPKVRNELFGPGRLSLEEHPEMLARAVRGLDLTKDQQEKIDAILKDAKEKIRAANDPAAKKAAAAETYKKIMAELTPDQQAKLKEWRPRPWMDGPPGAGSGPGEGKGRGAGVRAGRGGRGAGERAKPAQP